MAAIKPFNPGAHKPTERTPVPNSPPEGWPAILTEGVEKPTASTPGATYHALTFEITDGEHKGRKVFHNLNLNNPNPQAVQFAQDDLYYLCQACNFTQELHDTEQLKRLPLRIVTRLKERKPKPGQQATGEMQTSIVEFRKRDGSSVRKPGETTPAANPVAPSGKPFWDKS